MTWITRFGAAGRVAAAGLLATAGLTGCIPYAVGTTATPVPRGETATTLSAFVMPSIGAVDSSRGFSSLALDAESRIHLDERSDAGVRVVSGGGLVVNYKRLLTDPNSRTPVAIMPGAGFVNFGQHAHFELTLLASGYEPSASTLLPAGDRPRFVPYGGLRVMQVAPLNADAVHDRPTAGAFLGLKIGRTDFGISPEVGVFYDHSALGVRRGDVVVVPSINVHGDRLIRLVRDLLRGGQYARRDRVEPERPGLPVPRTLPIPATNPAPIGATPPYAIPSPVVPVAPDPRLLPAIGPCARERVGVRGGATARSGGHGCGSVHVPARVRRSP